MQKMYLTSGFSSNLVEIANKQLEDYQKYADQKTQIDERIKEFEKNNLDQPSYEYTSEYQALKNASNQLHEWMTALSIKNLENSQ